MDRAATVVVAAAVVAVLALGIGPRFLPYGVFVVLSGSMSPAIPVGSLVIDHPVPPSSIRQGDAITFPDPNDSSVFVTHRVIGITSNDGVYSFTTKGDANNRADSWSVRPAGQIQLVAAVIPGAGYLLAYSRTSTGIALFIALPGILLGFLILRDLWKPRA